jgi:acetyl-CoA carboxylase carboxyl transferase subunit beta
MGRPPLSWLDDIEQFVDDFRPWDGARGGVTGADPLAWAGYDATLREARERAETDESVVTGAGTVPGVPGVPGAMPSEPVAVVSSVFEFVGGSMGLAAGERIVAAYDRARAAELPVLVLARSGGARMQEGMLSLVQMARVADAARRHAEAGLLQVTYLHSPATGGVYASYASLADVIWAEPGALVGFAGPRVVEVMTGAATPADSHRVEAAEEAGLVDEVLSVDAARTRLSVLLAANRSSIRRGDAPDQPGAPPLAPNRPPIRRESRAEAWGVVMAARDPERPSGRDWVERILPIRVEITGDRAGGCDPVVVAGIGFTAAGTATGFVAFDRHRGDGRPRPAGFRTARRLLSLAARLKLPVVTFVDTPGADPTRPSEHAGLAGEIARTLAAITAHPAPTVSVVVGEGGSGGALALAATDRMYMLEGSIFSVIAPEGAAAILERDPARAPELAARLRLTARDMVELGIADALLPDELPPDTAENEVAAAIEHALATARPGDGRARLDSATRAWLHRT